MALRYLLQSRTMPGPIDWPDRLVPPPRAVIGTCISPAICTVVTISSTVLGMTTPKRFDLVDAGVGTVEPAGSRIETHFALELFGQVACQSGPLHFREIFHKVIFGGECGGASAKTLYREDDWLCGPWDAAKAYAKGFGSVNRR